MHPHTHLPKHPRKNSSSRTLIPHSSGRRHNVITADDRHVHTPVEIDNCNIRTPIMTTLKWHTTMPTSATPSLPITTLLIPKWTHPPSSHLANKDIWPTNLIDIIRAIRKIAPQKPTPPEFCLRTHKRGSQTELHGIDAQVQGQPHDIIRIITRHDSGVRLGAWSSATKHHYPIFFHATQNGIG